MKRRRCSVRYRILLCNCLQSAQTDVGAQAEITENSLSRKLSVIERVELLDRWVTLREIRDEADAIQEAADHAFGKAAEVSREVLAKPSGCRPSCGIRKRVTAADVRRLKSEAKQAQANADAVGSRNTELAAPKTPLDYLQH